MEMEMELGGGADFTVAVACGSRDAVLHCWRGDGTMARGNRLWLGCGSDQIISLAVEKTVAAPFSGRSLFLTFFTVSAP
jgi:hypothetical protein